jgi:hypothetical protein
MPDLTQSIIIGGFISAFVVSVVTISRQRRFEVRDLGSYVVAYIAGSNVPAAAFLCWYAFYPDPPSVATKLHGYEKYVALAGLCLLILSFISLWGLLRNAYEVK